MSRKFNILIPNATGPINIGDQAILTPTLRIIRSNFPKAIVIIHSNAPELYKTHSQIIVKPHLGEWVFLSDKSLVKRSFRVFQLLLCYLFLVFRIPFLPFDKKLVDLVSDYARADLIVFVGGGSLRSRKSLKEGLSLLLSVSMYYYAMLFKAKKIICPISFGPFGSRWHKKIALLAMKNFESVYVRERYSQKSFSQSSTKEVILSNDFAFLIPKIANMNSREKNLGFTVRKWLSPERQEVFENEVAEALWEIQKKHKMNLLPIIQVNSKFSKEDHDYEVTLRVISKLNRLGAKVLPVAVPHDLNSAVKVYSGLSFLLGTRMHSNIIAATQGVPFVAISYEYKTEGICEALKMGDYCIGVEDVNRDSLSKLLVKGLKNASVNKLIISQSIADINNNETKRWNDILTTTKGAFFDSF